MSNDETGSHSPAHFEKIPIEDPPGECEHEQKQQEALLERAWSNSMRESGHYMKSSFYRKVKCLMISWDKEHDNLCTEAEVSDLSSFLEKSFHYKVSRVLLKNDSGHCPPLHLMRHIIDFILEEDGPRTLLIVYYAGHGVPERSRDYGWGGLTLTGSRKPLVKDSGRSNKIVWREQEEILKYAKADVLGIFDCCYAGNLEWTWPLRGSRPFEFLGACSAGHLTCKPGPESFTTALMWALQVLKAEHGRFNVSQLAYKIRQAPGFPRDQLPALLIRTPGSIERITLSPLDDIRNEPLASSGDTISQQLLQLRFSLAERASIKMVEKLAKTIDRAFSNAQLPINWVAWQGLSSVGSAEPEFNGN